MKSADLENKWPMKWSSDTALDLFYLIMDSIGWCRRSSMATYTKYIVGYL